MDGPYAEVTWKILGAAIEVHRHLGPGLLEGTYRVCLAQQLRDDGLEVQAEVEVPIRYKDRLTGSRYRADIVVARSVLLELKAVEILLPVHSAQMLTYLKLTSLPVGLLINFNVPRLKQGIRRFINTPTPGPSAERPAVAFPPSA